MTWKDKRLRSTTCACLVRRNKSHPNSEAHVMFGMVKLPIQCVCLASGTEVLHASCVWWAAASHSPTKDSHSPPRPVLVRPSLQSYVRRCNWSQLNRCHSQQDTVEKQTEKHSRCLYLQLLELASHSPAEDLQGLPCPVFSANLCQTPQLALNKPLPQPAGCNQKTDGQPVIPAVSGACSAAPAPLPSRLQSAWKLPPGLPCCWGSVQLVPSADSKWQGLSCHIWASCSQRYSQGWAGDAWAPCCINSSS